MRRLAQFVLLAILLADFLPVRGRESLSCQAKPTAHIYGLTPFMNRLAKEAVGTDYLQYDSGPGYEPTGYDPVGNRRGRSRLASSARDPDSIYGTSASTSQSFDQNDRIDNDTTATTASTLFDGNGNTTSYQGNTYSYDFENRLLSASPGSVTFTYDGDGNRVKKVSTSGTVFYLIDDRNPMGFAQVLEEQPATAGASPTVTYLYGVQRISQKRHTGNTGTYYYGYDGLGSVRYLTTSGVTGFADGAVSDTYNYDAFGNLIDQKLLNTSGTALVSLTDPAARPATPNNYLFAGEQWDTHLAAYYNRARYYNPQTGRFWTVDTHEGNLTNPLSLHKYLYCAADPVNAIDPSGHFTLSEMFYSISARVYLGAQTYRSAITIGQVALAGITLAAFISEPEFRAFYVSSAGGPGSAGNILVAEIGFARAVGGNIIRHGTTSPNSVNLKFNVGDPNDFRVKASRLQRAAAEGNLVVVNDPQSIRDATAQAAYRRAVFNRYVRYLQQLGMTEEQAALHAQKRFGAMQADHKIDLQVSGALTDPNANSNLQMLDSSVNGSIGSQLAKEIERLNLKAGDVIHQVNVTYGP